MLLGVQFNKALYLPVVIIIVLGSYASDARVFNDHQKSNSIQTDKRELVRIFRYLDLKSLVPTADQEQYILDRIETPKHDIEIDDETSEEYDIIFYINPKLLEQLTGGYGIRPTSGSVNTGIVNKV